MRKSSWKFFLSFLFVFWLWKNIHFFIIATTFTYAFSWLSKCWTNSFRLSTILTSSSRSCFSRVRCSSVFWKSVSGNENKRKEKKMNKYIRSKGKNHNRISKTCFKKQKTKTKKFLTKTQTWIAPAITTIIINLFIHYIFGKSIHSFILYPKNHNR